jgi:hypothetical protein
MVAVVNPDRHSDTDQDRQKRADSEEGADDVKESIPAVHVMPHDEIRAPVLFGTIAWAEPISAITNHQCR